MFLFASFPVAARSESVSYSVGGLPLREVRFTLTGGLDYPHEGFEFPARRFSCGCTAKWLLSTRYFINCEVPRDQPVGCDRSAP